MSNARLFSRRGFLQRAGAASLLGAAPDLPSTAPFSRHWELWRPRARSPTISSFLKTSATYISFVMDIEVCSSTSDRGTSWIIFPPLESARSTGSFTRIIIAIRRRGIHLPLRMAFLLPYPAHERHLFEDVERLWANRRVFELYQIRNDFFSLTQDVPVNAVLRDYEVFRVGSREFIVQSSPGHTIGSISLLTVVDGRLVAFTGDLIHSSGKIKTMYDLQYYYQEHEGVDFAIYSLAELLKLKPQVACPSHGKEIIDPQPAMAALEQNLRDWYHYWKPDGTPTIDFKPLEVSPHVCCSSASYVNLLCNPQQKRQGKADRLRFGKLEFFYLLPRRDRHLRSHALCRT